MGCATTRPGQLGWRRSTSSAEEDRRGPRGVMSISDLGWFERMSQRAKARSEAGATDEARQYWIDNSERIRDELHAHVEQFLAGPPGGCTACYAWYRHKYGGWSWGHGDPINPKVRPWPEADGEPVEYCTHSCHGP